MPSHRFSPWWPMLVLGVLAVTGLAAQAFDVVDLRVWLEWARSLTVHWWFVAVLLLLQVLFFTFALPGSALLWLVAPLYAPGPATVILTVGGCVGALGAYGFARQLTGAALAQIQGSRGFHLMQREGGFLLQCALRLAPGFPHSVINYTAGTLRLPLAPFLASAVIGFALKSGLYSQTIHAALAADKPADLLNLQTLWPLLAAVTVVLAARAWAGRRRR
ncbi:MAG: VTT domain-containing protein [Hydrogenophaga sp.]|uniref:VTT domain-containing protein n=1 Tax=Hydrogenophaga sp. TaxID=1904254 RepID=UPI001BC2907B|nr:VTT domain-containing protein [Hydrogenophaga sp.]MBS3911573.1 VTT domain-containing protein [Hydrogenophaga sp.]MDO9149005.1 VTT domain-containing protein [Hydrogenophaga sp.]MDO9606739.1 VTT domain-containing protein [Hydrogenophaga sp.]